MIRASFATLAGAGPGVPGRPCHVNPRALAHRPDPGAYWGALGCERSDKAALGKRWCAVKVFRFPGGHTVAPSDVIDEAVGWLEQKALERMARTAQKEGPPPKPGTR